MIEFNFHALNLELDEAVLTNGIVESARHVAAFFNDRDIIAIDLLPVPPRRKWPEDYPLEWTKAERKEYFDAVNRGETTFPYQRTGKLFSDFAMNVKESPLGATIEIVNPTPYAADVIGTFESKDKQKRYHYITGWVPVIERMPKLTRRLENSLQEALQLYLDDTVIRF